MKIILSFNKCLYFSVSVRGESCKESSHICSAIVSQHTHGHTNRHFFEAHNSSCSLVRADIEPASTLLLKRVRQPELSGVC